MPLVPLHGHEALRARLLDAVGRGTLPQSLLLHGEAGIGKQRLALWLAQVLACERDVRPCGACRHCRMAAELTHPDITWVFPRPRLKDSDPSPDEVKNDLIEGAQERLAAHGLYAAPSGTEGIYVPTIRMVVRGASVTPALATRKVIVIGDAERMVPQEGSDQAANAFLKLLEEPPANTFLILTTSVPGALLPTIRSRVVAVRVAPLTQPEVITWLGEASVTDALKKLNLPAGAPERAAIAAGAPGRLLGASASDAAFDLARRFIETAQSGDAERATKLAMSQGSAGARGAFTDLLDAIETELRNLMKQAVRTGDDTLARGTAIAVESIEEAKALAGGNVNPQLIAWALLTSLGDALAAARR